MKEYNMIMKDSSLIMKDYDSMKGSSLTMKDYNMIMKDSSLILKDYERFQLDYEKFWEITT